MSSSALPQQDVAATRLYRAVWRWHFYAGLFVIPFLIMLAITGAFMMIYSDQSSEFGWIPNVQVEAQTLPVSAQAKAALVALPDGKLATYIAPQANNRPAFFEFSKGDAYFAIAVDPYKGTVLNAHDESTTYRTLAEKIHGSLLLGTIGDRLIEVAASLTIRAESTAVSTR